MSFTLEEKNSLSLMLRGGAGLGGGGAVTVTRASAVAFPPGPVALAVYVVEVVGLTERLPEGSTLPKPPSIDTDVAFADCHDRVDDCPCSIADGDAESRIVGEGGGGVGGGVSVFSTGGGAGAVFLQLTPKKDMPTISSTARAYVDLLITGASFLPGLERPNSSLLNSSLHFRVASPL